MSFEGVFFLVEDVDSMDVFGELCEGVFYFWEFDEVVDVVGDELLFVKVVFGFWIEGNILYDF